MKKVIYNLLVIVFVFVPLLGAIGAVVLLWKRAVHWSDLALLLSSYSLTAIGIGTGFHRMIAHRSFQANPIVKFVLLVLGTMTLQGPLIGWTAVHIKHHTYSDRKGDPHSPLQGLLFAHFTWLFGEGILQAPPEIYCPHLLKDRMAVFVDRTAIVWMALGLAIPFLIGGWTGFLWGGLVRLFLTDHVTWSVNSVCHRFGKRPFDTNDASRNEWIVGVLAFGEGWHNNHHAFPRSAFHGLEWWQVDIAGYFIRLLELAGLVRDVNRVTPRLKG